MKPSKNKLNEVDIFSLHSHSCHVLTNVLVISKRAGTIMACLRREIAHPTNLFLEGFIHEEAAPPSFPVTRALSPSNLAINDREAVDVPLNKFKPAQCSNVYLETLILFTNVLTMVEAFISMLFVHAIGQLPLCDTCYID